MSMTPDAFSAPHLRAADADRDAVLAELSEHFQAGRLTTDEFEERSGQALAARTLGDLAELMTDLPRTAPPAPVPGRPQPPARLAMVPLIAVILALAVATSAVTVGSQHHGWTAWWIIPLVFLIVRRLAWHRGAGSSSQSADRRGDWGGDR